MYVKFIIEFVFIYMDPTRRQRGRSTSLIDPTTLHKIPLIMGTLIKSQIIDFFVLNFVYIFFGSFAYYKENYLCLPHVIQNCVQLIKLKNYSGNKNNKYFNVILKFSQLRVDIYLRYCFLWIAFL
jgi:hypothetical protein